jgi:hypothetical protein
MNYTKPEVAVLGDAVRVIEHTTSKLGQSQDGNVKNLIPAYDLDE